MALMVVQESWSTGTMTSRSANTEHQINKAHMEDRMYNLLKYYKRLKADLNPMKIHFIQLATHFDFTGLRHSLFYS